MLCFWLIAQLVFINEKHVIKNVFNTADRILTKTDEGADRQDM